VGAASLAAGALAQEQRAAAQDAAQAASQAGSAAQSGQASPEVESALEDAAQAMNEAAESAQSGRSASAAASQREAREALRRAQEELARSTRPAGGEQSAAAEALAAEQEAIRRELLELARRNEERPEGGPSPALDRAAQSAQDAAQSLGEGDLGEAQEEEAQVQREIARALEELAEEERQYQKLRQEELLFKIGEELKGLIAGHDEARAAVREIDAARAGSERPSRAERLRLRRVSQDESALAVRLGEMGTAIEAEEARVFALWLRESERDLQRIAHDLSEQGDWDTGARTQGLQDDVDGSLRKLLAALESEQQRRREEEEQSQEPGNEGGQNQPENRLVPDVAELKLLRTMEVETIDRLDRVLLLHPELAEEGAEVDPRLFDEILRLAERHERTTVLFGTFRERLGIPPPEGEERP